MSENKLHDLLTDENQDFSTISGIPCLYADKEITLADWSQKISSFFSEEEINIKHLQHQINNEKSERTKKRLNDTLQGRSSNLKQMKKILKDFYSEKENLTVFSSQQIHSYFDNIFRDWSWGEDELQVYLEKTKEIEFAGKSVLILGSGAGGFSYQLAKSNPDATFINVEHNPFLAAVDTILSTGKSLKLFEVSQFPKSVDLTVEKRELEKFEQLPNKETILATFPDLPFKDEVFDVVIAPWFLDILDMPFPNALYCAKEFLKPDGTFYFFGPSNIHKKDFRQQFCHEEIEDSFQHNFKEISSSQEMIPYMQSPQSSQHRTEAISFIIGTNKKESEADWQLSEHNFDLVFTPEFEQFKIMQNVKSQILSHINGNTNVEDLAIILQNQFGLTVVESEPYAKKFLEKIKFEY